MSYFRQIRKNSDNAQLVKELSEKLSRAQAETGIEDISLLRQMRVDTDNIAYTDTSDNQLGGDLEDTDTIAYTDTDSTDLTTSGTFTVSHKDDGSDQTDPLKINLGDVG